MSNTHAYSLLCDPDSRFYNEEWANERYYSTDREVEVDAFFKHIRVGRDTTQTQICAPFITVFRPNIKRPYIFDSVSSALAGCTPQERSALHLAVRFADLDPTQNPSYSTSWFMELLDDNLTYKDVRMDENLNSIFWQWLGEGKAEQKSI